MLNIIYFSNVSENTQRFILRLTAEADQQGIPFQATRLPLKGDTITTEEDYILIAPSYGTDKTGHVPPQVKKFLTNPTNREHCVGVVGCGNINFGDEFAVSGDVIAAKLNVPLLWKFELSGFQKDINMLLRLIKLDRQTIEEIITQKNRKVTA